MKLEQLGIGPMDVFIVIYESPLENWGIRGGVPASEVDLVPIYQNRIMFAKDLSNKIFSPPRHQDTKLKYNKQFFFVSWCLCGHSFRFIRVRF
jgi:hypothetical protein